MVEDFLMRKRYCYECLILGVCVWYNSIGAVCMCVSGAGWRLLNSALSSNLICYKCTSLHLPIQAVYITPPPLPCLVV